MEIGFTIATVLLLLFGLLATFDGIYLHIIKYRLYRHKESRFEHVTHTIRAIFFPFIVYFLFLQNTNTAFYIGIAFVALDLLTLGVDAFVEKDSRSFMGGLPRWEYIVHLFVNGFHFASIAVFLVLKLELGKDGVALRHEFSGIRSYETFVWFCKNIIPGAVLFGCLHLFVAFDRTAAAWDKLIGKINKKNFQPGIK